MSYEELCTIDDVQRVGQLTDEQVTELEDVIEEQIPYSSLEVYQDAEFDTIPTTQLELYNAMMACSYHVLIYLQQRELITDDDSDIQSFRDGDFSVTYKDGNGQDKPKSRQDWYKYYIQQLKPSPPLSVKARRPDE